MSDEDVIHKVLHCGYVIFHRNNVKDYCVWYLDKSRHELWYHQYDYSNKEILYDEPAFSQNPIAVLNRDERNVVIPYSLFRSILDDKSSSVRYV